MKPLERKLVFLRCHLVRNNNQMSKDFKRNVRILCKQVIIKVAKEKEAIHRRWQANNCCNSVNQAM